MKMPHATRLLLATIANDVPGEEDGYLVLGVGGLFGIGEHGRRAAGGVRACPERRPSAGPPQEHAEYDPGQYSTTAQ